MNIFSRVIKKLFKKVFPILSRHYWCYIILAHRQGQHQTFKQKKVIDHTGNPIPWYTYPAIEYLNNFDFASSNVFEFSSGYSTLYWSKRANEVVSVESDPHWYELVISHKLNKNTVVLLREDMKSYIASLKEQEKKFDVIIIDGAWRWECVQESVQYLKSEGIIILDNSDWYPESAHFLRKKGMFQIDFNGFGPLNNYCWTTSVFIQVKSHIQEGYSNSKPIGGIHNNIK